MLGCLNPLRLFAPWTEQAGIGRERNDLQNLHNARLKLLRHGVIRWNALCSKGLTAFAVHL